MNKILFIVLLLNFLCSPLFAESTVPNNLLSLAGGPYYTPYAIVVDKTARLTSIWKVEDKSYTKVAEFISDHGKKEGDKHKLGDHRTPEGVYFFKDMYEGSNLNYEEYGLRAFDTNYPNLFDKREGKTGSGIWLHAIPDSKSLERGSRGCVVVRNKAIMEVSRFVDIGKTPFIVNDAVEFINTDKALRERKRVQDFISNWQNAWQSKDIESYMSFYSKERFWSLKMNWKKWKAYKSELNKNYSSISVNFSQPVALRHKGEYTVRMLQEYQSDLHKDFGEKILYLKEEDGKLQIIAEKWTALNNKLAFEQFESDVKKSGRKISLKSESETRTN